MAGVGRWRNQAALEPSRQGVVLRTGRHRLDERFGLDRAGSCAGTTAATFSVRRPALHQLTADVRRFPRRPEVRNRLAGHLHRAERAGTSQDPHRRELVRRVPGSGAVEILGFSLRISSITSYFLQVRIEAVTPETGRFGPLELLGKCHFLAPNIGSNF